MSESTSEEYKRKAKLFDRLLDAVKTERNERVKFESGWESDPSKLDAASIEIVSIINENSEKNESKTDIY
jgi:hypothetical protein